MASRASAAPLKAEAVTQRAQTSLWAATFNVRTSRADRGTSRHWLRRAVAVAREIKSRNPGVMAIQELDPGRADGKKTKLRGALRQTESLEKAQESVGAGKYQLVRTTAYVKPAKSTGTQGGRLLYDTKRYRLVTTCPETTGKSNYNASCSIPLPILSSDGRIGVGTGRTPSSRTSRPAKNFFFVSVHLDERHSGNLSKEEQYDALRRA